MSILIKGMEMPTSCISCLLNFGEKRPEYGLTIYCPYSDGVISWRDKAFDNGRLASCGIVQVPEPHGDLIDRNNLLMIINQIKGQAESPERFVLDAVERAVKSRRAIIPGEGGIT